MDEDLCFHWMRNQLSEPAAEDSKESWCLLWQWVLRRSSSIPSAKAPYCDLLRWWLAHETLNPRPWRLPSVQSVWRRALVLWTQCLSLKDSRCNEGPDGNNKYHSDFLLCGASYSGAFVEGNGLKCRPPPSSSPLSLLGSQPPLESKG